MSVGTTRNRLLVGLPFQGGEGANKRVQAENARHAQLNAMAPTQWHSAFSRIWLHHSLIIPRSSCGFLAVLLQKGAARDIGQIESANSWSYSQKLQRIKSS